MSEPSVIYSYQGKMDNSILNKILAVLEVKMKEYGEKVPYRKKVNSVLIECCQNLMHHTEQVDNNSQPVVTIKKVDGGYEIIAGNPIHDANAQKLKQYIDSINSMDKEYLREFYQKVLTNGQISAVGGGGLGILNILRKTRDNHVSYEFKPLTDKYQYFNMFIQV